MANNMERSIPSYGMRVEQHASTRNHDSVVGWENSMTRMPENPQQRVAAERAKLRKALSLLGTLPTTTVPAVAPLPTPNTVPHRVNEQFVGRDADLMALANLLKAQHTTAIVSDACDGVGKTQLASAFAHHYGQYFLGGVFWLDASSETALIASIAACGEKTTMAVDGFQTLSSIDEKARRVLQAWQDFMPRLLIYDNLDDARLLAYTPGAGSCRILLTSRYDISSRLGDVQVHHLDVLERPDSLRLLTYGRDQTPLPISEEDGERICDAVGDLPLAVGLANAYLKLHPDQQAATDLGDALEAVFDDELNDELAELLPGDYIDGIAGLFQVCYAQIDNTMPINVVAKTLLHRLAYCAPAPIPYRLIVRLIDHDPDDDDMPDELDHALQRLSSLGLISILHPPEDKSPSVHVHRLFAAYVRSRATTIEDSKIVEAAITSELYEADKTSSLRRWQPYLPHALWIAGGAAVRGDEIGAMLLGNLASLLHAQGDLRNARVYYEKALAIRQSVLGAGHNLTAQSRNNLGLVLQAQGDLDGARQHYDHALTIHQQTLGTTHPLTALSLNNLGLVLQAQGDLAGARQHYEKALAITQQAVGLSHPDTAQCLNNLASVLQAQGDLAGARRAYEKALVITQQVFGLSHTETAQSLNNLGSLLQSMGAWVAARRYYEQALAITRQASEGPNIHVARDLNNLGGLLRARGDIEEARSYYEQALEMYQHLLGPSHPLTAQSLNNLGGLLRAQGDLAGAQRCYEQALAITRQVHGPSHPLTALSLSNLGSLRRAQGDFDAARSCYEQALAIHQQVVGVLHLDTARSANNLGYILQESGDFDGARPYYEQALDIYQQVLGHDHLTTASSLNNLAILHYYQDRLTEAERLMQQVIAIRERALGPDHADTQNARTSLAAIRAKIKGNEPKGRRFVRKG